MGFNTNAAAGKALEEKYSDRGLKFSVSSFPVEEGSEGESEHYFLGSVPVQAFGWVDGMRFYFRFRGNWASLRVGPYVRELEELLALRVNQDRAARFARLKKDFAAGEIDEFDFRLFSVSDERLEPVVEEDAFDFVPTQVVAAAGCEGPIPGDDYNGSLSPDEAYSIFVRLMEGLEDVPEDEQVDERTRKWLYEGR